MYSLVDDAVSVAPVGTRESDVDVKADVAQMVEHVHGKDGVAGSIPAIGSSAKHCRSSSVGRARLS